MSESPEELVAVEQLLHESNAVREWLARVDAATVSTPDAVRARVREDYQRRLDQLLQSLRAHVGVIGDRLAAHRSEQAELTSSATAAREALAESELRHVVGEFDDARFHDEQKRHTSDLESYQLGIAAVEEQIEKLDAVFAAVSSVPEQAAERIDAPAVTVDDTARDHFTMDIEELAPDPDSATLASIFEAADATVDAAVDGDAAAATSFGAGPLSFRPSGNAPSSPARPAVQPGGEAHGRSFQQAAPLGMPSADVPPRFVRPGERMPGPATTAALPRTEAQVESRTESPVTSAVGRTLRCAECGAMNRPLEWYCEKCGAELTAL